MEGSRGVTRGSDLRGVKEALRGFFFSGRGATGSECGVCLGVSESGEVLGEEAAEVVLQALLLSEGVDAGVKTETGLELCGDCVTSLNTLTDLFLRMEDLRCEFNDLRRNIGRQVILMSLGRTEEELAGWEEQLKRVEHIFPSCLKVKMEEEEGGAPFCDSLVEEEELGANDEDYTMPPIVLLEPLEEPATPTELSDPLSIEDVCVKPEVEDKMDETEIQNGADEIHDDLFCGQPGSFTTEQTSESLGNVDMTPPVLLTALKEEANLTTEFTESYWFEEKPRVNSEMNDLETKNGDSEIHDNVLSGHSVGGEEEESFVEVSLQSKKKRRHHDSSETNDSEEQSEDSSSAEEATTPSHRCQRCGKTFRLERYLRRHTSKVHQKRTSRGKKLACSLCERVFTRQVDLDRHETSFHRVAPPLETSPQFPCTHCHLTFPDPPTLKLHKLRRHLLGSTPSGDPQCPFCLEFFPDKPTLVEHKDKFHFGGRLPPPRGSQGGHSPQNVHCFLCKTILTPEDLKAHEESAEHQQKVRSKSLAHCDVCRLNFARNLDALRLHLKNPEHQEELRKLQQFDLSTFCVLCRRSFPSRSSLTNHNRSLPHIRKCVDIQETAAPHEGAELPH